jgi:hypothetical protein
MLARPALELTAHTLAAREATLRLALERLAGSIGTAGAAAGAGPLAALTLETASAAGTAARCEALRRSALELSGARTGAARRTIEALRATAAESTATSRPHALRPFPASAAELPAMLRAGTALEILEAAPGPEAGARTARSCASGQPMPDHLADPVAQLDAKPQPISSLTSPAHARSEAPRTLCAATDQLTKFLTPDAGTESLVLAGVLTSALAGATLLIAGSTLIVDAATHRARSWPVLAIWLAGGALIEPLSLGAAGALGLLLVVVTLLHPRVRARVGAGLGAALRQGGRSGRQSAQKGEDEDAG